jgi:hypothetical protein
VKIKSEIEKRNTQKTWMKALYMWRLYGRSDKGNLITALQAYQTITLLSASDVLGKFHKEHGIFSDDCHFAFNQIHSNISALAADVSVVGNEVKGLQVGIIDLQSTVGKTATAIGEVKGQIERTNSAIEAFARDVLKEVQALRQQSTYPVLGVIDRTSNLDRARLDVKLDTLNEYLHKLRASDGVLGDLEIWELAWDFLEIYRQFGACALELVEGGSFSQTQ